MWALIDLIRLNEIYIYINLKNLLYLYDLKFKQLTLEITKIKIIIIVGFYAYLKTDNLKNNKLNNISKSTHSFIIIISNKYFLIY